MHNEVTRAFREHINGLRYQSGRVRGEMDAALLGETEDYYARHMRSYHDAAQAIDTLECCVENFERVLAGSKVNRFWEIVRQLQNVLLDFDALCKPSLGMNKDIRELMVRTAILVSEYQQLAPLIIEDLES